MNPIEAVLGAAFFVGFVLIKKSPAAPGGWKSNLHTGLNLSGRQIVRVPPVLLCPVKVADIVE